MSAVAFAATALLTVSAVNAENANAEPGTKVIMMLNHNEGIVNMCIDNVTQQSFGHCTGNIVHLVGKEVNFPYNDGDQLTFVLRIVAGRDVSTQIDQPTSAYSHCVASGGIYTAHVACFRWH
jgi:hypothetical protein